MSVSVKPVNDRIRLARANAGLSLNAFAKKLGMTSTGVWNWHHDNTSPRPDVLPRVAEALDVSVEWLRTGEETTAAPLTLDSVLASARTSIARILNVEPSRVRLTMAVDDTDPASPAWLADVQRLVSELPQRPLGSTGLISQRHAAARDGH